MYKPGLHRFAVLTAMATLALIGIGGLVTSNEAGLAVYDWPTSYGYNMFFFPIKWWNGGIFYEHSHRLLATIVGVLVVALTRWLGGTPSRRPLAIIGLAEILAGVAIFCFWPELKATGHFLTGVGGVVLLAAVVWVRNEPTRPLVPLGWWVFGLVQFQGLLGGLRVVLINGQIGIFHAALAQLFFVLTCTVALLTGKWWVRQRSERVEERFVFPGKLRMAFLFATILIFAQLVLGATMRHQHAGLSIPDFPLAYGKLWPAMDADSIAHYNQLREQRDALTSLNPITAFQVGLQMAHRLLALLILAAVAHCAWHSRRTLPAVRRLSVFWLCLILGQAGLGAATVLSNKAADIATAHVLVGALSLATGVSLCIICRRSPVPERDTVLSNTGLHVGGERPLTAGTAAT